MSLLDVPPPLSDRDLGWVAGLLEGEGCFFLTTRKNKDGSPRPLLSVRVTMTDEDVIRRLHQVLGVGNVLLKTRKKSANPNWKDAWEWATANVEVVVPLLQQLRPFMGARRGEKIDAMLAAAEGWERRYVREHGTVAMYRRGCKCAFCRRANADQVADYRATH